jgi:hypothetical protein
MFTKRMAAALGIVLAAVFVTVAAAPHRSGTTTTSCASVLGADVCTWVVMDGGRATELGATIPMALVEAAPSGGEMVWPPPELASVRLPAAAREALGIDHLGINWEAHGHPPAAFLTEHFDFHFYNVPGPEVSAIDCSDLSKPADQPAGYALPDIDVPGMGTFIGLCVPSMGMHAMLADEVDDTDPFTADMLIGYYGAEPIFFEPMISRALLRTQEDFTVAMPEVTGLPEGVRYPTDFRAEYDARAKAYRLVFTGFYGE